MRQRCVLLGELARRIVITGSWHDLVLTHSDMERIEEFISRNDLVGVLLPPGEDQTLWQAVRNP